MSHRQTAPAMFVPVFDDSSYEPPRDPRDSDRWRNAAMIVLAIVVALIAIASCGKGGA